MYCTSNTQNTIKKKKRIKPGVLVVNVHTIQCNSPWFDSGWGPFVASHTPLSHSQFRVCVTSMTYLLKAKMPTKRRSLKNMKKRKAAKYI